MRTWQNSLFAIRLVFRACPAYPVWTLLVAITSVTVPLTGVLGIKLLIDALTERDLRTTGLVILLYGLITAITAGFQSWYNTAYEPAAKTRITGALSAILLEKIAGFDLATSENSEFYNRYSRAVAEANTRAQEVVKTLCGLAGNLLSIGTLTAILISLDWVVMLLTLGGAALMFLLNLKKSKLSFRQYLERTRLERQINYIQRVYYEPQYAREIRLFSMNLFMTKRYKRYFSDLHNMLRQQGLRMWLFSGLEKLLNECLYIVITLFYLTSRFFAGAITIGGFSALFNGIFQFGDQIYSLLSRLPQLYEHSLYLETVQTILSTQASIENTRGIEMDPRIAHSIELRHVTFAYPGQPPVFNDLSLKIEAGEQVALLGHNGAGKSTLIRLILRFYDPQAGQILVDGQDIRSIDIRSLRSCFGVVLQDFQHFAFSITDNITLGRTQCPEDKLRAAIEQAQLADKIELLPQGLATPVTREFDDSGIQLSGGEYQKLALARAYVQDSGILLFDEPSSALDPIAEHELFAGLRRYTRKKTVLFVCHKMSLAVHADRAILLEQGRIIESGPPKELLQAGGLYSQLYRLQTQDHHPALS